ncbi:LysM peptidoglycan-binding domain-containing protein [Aspergillus neoniger CBS 115656]|uniref:LysM domain-containing protein n=1 Tax=Aspergillus neoniger (strain CBS 115656) TaxID=1448310 RepID=A0A318Y734_ASPNB|nr:hypothetical protein BO87DRAFT_343434 [Aspergillus neoniger CBS 115656]PYH30085.1 hypothetical protein BO87DRAFT_343434 [Aspergillus neoniger CBS 115656]
MMVPTSLKAGLFVLPQLHLAWAMVLAPRQQISCSYEYAASSGDTCQSVAADWGLTVQALESLNPKITCPDLVAGQSYCVLGTVSSSGPTVSSSSLATSTSTSTISIVPIPSTTSSSSSSSSSAPYQPQQTGTAADCDQFYLVETGDSCGKIEAQFGISASEFLDWNPSVNSDCTNILAGYYYCVDVPGATTGPVTTTTIPVTTTTPGDGITTPTPIQTGMTDKCNKFDLVQSGDTCEAIAAKYEIPLATFYSWNPAVSSSCSDLDLGYYVCVDTIDYTVPTTTTSAGNGITTPTPYEPGMVSDCTTFYFVRSGDTCGSIASTLGITVGDIEKWNPKVGSGCKGLWLNDYICVGV